MTTSACSTDALAERLFDAALGALELHSIYLGSELGLYRALAQHGPQTADELARAAGIGGVLPQVAEAYRTGGGVPTMPDVVDRLQAGTVRVAR